jgi:uncharacterized protein (TIGR00661 family)
MRILYGVVGEGLGHATRSRAIIEHLARRGHRVRVVVSSRAHAFLRERLADHPRVDVREIQGLSLAFDGGTLDLWETLLTNLELAPRNLRKNYRAYRDLVEEGFTPDCVFTDYESFAFLYAKNHRIPVVSIDNMQVLDRCRLDKDITKAAGFDFGVAKAAVKVKVPGAYHYLITSFFYPAVRKKRTTLVPPILRPEILAATPEPGDHVLVYQTASATTDLLPSLRTLPGKFVLYGLNRDGVEGNVELRSFSEQGFVDDLRTARACIATGGFSLMSEAVHLRVPMLAVPLAGQFEQELNSRYLAKLGYGAWTTDLERDVVDRFLRRVDDHRHKLHRGYEPVSNEMTFACVDELLGAIELEEKGPKVLRSPARGKWRPDA